MEVSGFASKPAPDDHSWRVVEYVGVLMSTSL